MFSALGLYVLFALLASACWGTVAIAGRRRERVILSRPGLKSSIERRLLRDLPAALESGCAYLVYQPKLHIRSGEVDGVEALVRWQHPSLGAVSRDTLIAMLEKRRKIHAFTLWVLRRAIIDQGALAKQGQVVSVHVNVSASLFSDPDFISDVCALIGSASGAIGLEITETILIENSPLAMAGLLKLISHGISISIDDYGSGLSSLAYLKELPAKELKIDKLFVSGMTVSHRDPLIVRSTIDLAHALGLTVVAEGVESLATLALLKVMGCDYAQGFLISPALPINELLRFLNSGAYRDMLKLSPSSVRPPLGFWTRVVHHREVDPVSAATSIAR